MCRSYREGNSMEARLDYWKASPEGLAAFRHLQAYVDRCGLDHRLMELVKTRASQLNGCAYCLDMHTKDARAAGETEQRLYALPAWRETPFFTDQERAALDWTEAVTRIAPDQVDDQRYQELRAHFSEKEIVDLTLAIIAINGWNRLAIPFRTPPGSYQPATVRSKSAGAVVSTVPTIPIPALLTSTSHRPWVASTRAASS